MSAEGVALAFRAVRRARDRSPDPGIDYVAEQVLELRQEIEATRREWASVHEELRDLAHRALAIQTTADERTAAEATRLRHILQLVYDREPELRERVREVRRSDDYERAYSDAEPLVSIVIPTYDNTELLVDRAVASALRQTYPNIEVVVVGDTAPPDTAQRLSMLGDPRIRYRNLRIRGPYPAEPRNLWHVAGVPPRNEAVALARGRWIAPLDDDDEFSDEHVEQLLNYAREERLEVAYGIMRCLMNDGATFELGSFPPNLGHFGWQAAIFLADLRFFEMELADSLFFSPADWSLCRRMLRAGVRFGMVERVVVDHYQSRFSPDYSDETQNP